MLSPRLFVCTAFFGPVAFLGLEWAIDDIMMMIVMIMMMMCTQFCFKRRLSSVACLRSHPCHDRKRKTCGCPGCVS